MKRDGTRRIADPASELHGKVALRRLRDLLRLEDPTVRHIPDARLAAVTHLSRCKPVPVASTRTSHLAIPESRKRCCGEALAIKYLSAERGVHSAVQPLYEAIVKAEPALRDVAALLQAPLDSMLRAIGEQRGERSTSSKPLSVEISRPVENPPLLWLVDALRSLYTSASDDAPSHVLNEQLVLLLNAVVLATNVRNQLETNLRERFALPALHAPSTGSGGPGLGFLNELSRLLAETGHEPSEVAHLLPDKSGSLGAANRARERVRPAKRKKRPR
ncbi:MAG: hypothetical protein ABI321_10665 [Polyangia bacterium]